jgi:hypothetical protein
MKRIGRGLLRGRFDLVMRHKSRRQRMIRKRVERFSEKIMRQQ